MAASCQLYDMARGEAAGVKLPLPADATMADVVSGDEKGREVPIQPLNTVISPQETWSCSRFGWRVTNLPYFVACGAFCRNSRRRFSSNIYAEREGYRLYHLRVGSAPIPIDRLDPESWDSHNVLALPQ